MLTREQKKNRKKWVAALRSGKYAQTKGVLCAVGDNGAASFCCLGVAAHVTDDRPWQPAAHHGFRPLGSPYGPVLDDKGRRLVGLTNAQVTALWQMNDIKGATFDQIADKIDEWTKEGR